jgi:cytochrome c biogenesis factor
MATEVGILSKPYEDLYVILADTDLQRVVGTNDPSAQSATFTFLVKPLVGLIWAGGLVLTLGSLIALWPSAERVRAEAPARARSRPVASPEPAPAGD